MNSTPPSELGRAGQLVAGKFRLDAMIGRGGMGSVWSATHVGLGHRLAIKLIAREFVRSSEALRRFDAEAKAAARLQSRHVVQVFDNGTLDDGTPYIAMELLAGENVSDRITRAGPLSLSEAVEVMGQCCKALGRAHAAGIVHRDIKPDNIFLAREPDEDADVVKILDFGVAKMAIGFEGGSQVTVTGALLGTPLFMSPEQIRGSRGIDHRTDLYSLGLVFYTMVTGQLAISGETFGDILIKICTEPLPSLTAAAPSLPYGMEAWFRRVCAREPDGRCQSAQELIETLRVAAGAPVRASGSPPYAVAPTIHSLSSAGDLGPPLRPQAAELPVLPNPATPAFGQSAAAVSVTAAGVPRRPIGAWVAGGTLAALFLLGGVVLFTLAPRASHDRDSTASDLSIDGAAVAPGAAPGVAAALAGSADSKTALADAASPAKARASEVPSLEPSRPPSPASPAAPVHPAVVPAAGVPTPVTPPPIAPTPLAPPNHPPAPAIAPIPPSRPAPAPINVGY